MILNQIWHTFISWNAINSAKFCCKWFGNLIQHGSKSALSINPSCQTQQHTICDYYYQYDTFMSFCCSVSEDSMDVDITNGTIVYSYANNATLVTTHKESSTMRMDKMHISLVSSSGHRRSMWNFTCQEWNDPCSSSSPSQCSS